MVRSLACAEAPLVSVGEWKETLVHFEKFCSGPPLSALFSIAHSLLALSPPSPQAHIKRIQRELRDIRNEPVPGIALEPLENDIW